MDQIAKFKINRLPKISVGNIFCVSLLSMIALLLFLIFLSFYGPNANQLDTIAQELSQQDRTNWKQELFLKLALAWREVFLGPDHLELAHGLRALAEFYQQQGKLDLAEQALKQALSIHESQFSKAHMLSDRQNTANVDYLETLTALITLYLQQERYKDAAPLLTSQCDLMKNATRTPVEYIQLYKQQINLVARHVDPATIPQGRTYFHTKIWNVSLGKAVNTWQRLKQMSPEYLHIKALRDLIKSNELNTWYYCQLENYDAAVTSMKEAMKLSYKEHMQCTGEFERLLCDGYDLHFFELAGIYASKGDFQNAESCYKSFLDLNKTSDHSDSSRSVRILLALRDFADLESLVGKNDQAAILNKQAANLSKQLGI
jgi:tetratricopeptide (TPR) repeat protein